MQMDMSLFSSDSDRVCSDRDRDLKQSVDLISSDLNRKLDLESYDVDSTESTPKSLDSNRKLDLESYDDNSTESTPKSLDSNRKLDLESYDDNLTESTPKSPDSKVHEDEHEEEHEEEDDDDDFTFMYIGDKDSPIYADKVFEDGQIRPVFPLFDQNLLLGGEYEVEEIDRLPVHPTVDKIFIESPSSTASEHGENDDSATGPFCVWSKESVTGTAELSKKSNSTGFSKLWRIREKVNRSNSDGRDAFVFLKSSDRTSTTKTTTTTTTSSSSSSASANPATGAGTFVKVNATGEKSRVVKQGTKAKKPTVSPHEAYMRSKGGHTEEERRRSYLPYRPELMGFFTNVHGGLSRNVHPY